MYIIGTHHYTSRSAAGFDCKYCRWSKKAQRENNERVQQKIDEKEKK